MGWLENLYSSITSAGQAALEDIWFDGAQTWTLVPLADTQVDGDITARTRNIQANEEYVTVNLKSFNLVHTRQGWSRYYGAIHSFISLSNPAVERSTVGRVISPNQLMSSDAAHADRIITVDQPLFGPAPYCGGNLELELGLFSVKTADLARPYLDLLQELSPVAKISFVSVALPFVEPLKKGVELITGSGDTELQIGLDTKRVPQTGWWLLMRAPKGSVDTAQLRVTPSDFRLIDQQGELYSDVPYLIFSIEATTRREEYYEIPELKEAYNKLRKLVRDASTDPKIADEAKLSLQYFIRLLKTSPDLVMADAQYIARKIQEWYGQVMDAGLDLNTRGILESDHLERHLPSLEEVPLYGPERDQDSGHGWGRVD
ncbi:hypothetical protein IAD21_03813 [Abditibacteriota bacterium]|nr:hypothetical protein IAD21_03813 [Abditibacteriota bacterium]